MKKLPQTRQTLHNTLARARPQRNITVVRIPIVEEESLPELIPEKTIEHPRVLRSAPPIDGRTDGSGVFRIIVTSLIMFSIGALVTVAAMHERPSQTSALPPVLPSVTNSEVVPATVEGMFRRALDGARVSSPEEENPPLVAVSIDNSQDAPPPLGVDKALWVYEFPAESTITRLIGIFAASATAEDVAQIGPVRSVRPYMAEIARSLGAILVHSGGSPDALALVGRFSKDYPSINEFSQTPYFWRDPTREAPHNLFTAITRLRGHKIVQSRVAHLMPLVWQDAATVNQQQGINNDLGSKKQLVIGYPKPYQALWRYSSSDELFHRVDREGNAWKLPDGTELVTSTIVVQFASMQVLDRVGRRDIQLKGTGDAMVLSRGWVELGRWVRNSANDRTTLETVDGEPIALPSGRVWWSIVQKGTDVTFE